MKVIESDEDFETKNLYDMDVRELDRMEDRRPSPFWKMTYPELAMRLVLFIIVVWVNENNYLNPHDPNYIFVDWKI